MNQLPEIPGRSRAADVETLATAFLNELYHDTSCYDTWAVDDKRVFGNSDLYGDIIELFDIKIDEDGLYALSDKSFIKGETVVDYIKSLWLDLGDYIKSEWKKRKDLT